MEEQMTLEQAQLLIRKKNAEIDCLHHEIDEKAYYVGILEEEIRSKEIGLWTAGIAFVVTFVSLLIFVL